MERHCGTDDVLLALIDVAEWVASENLSYDVSTVRFASTFPRYADLIEASRFGFTMRRYEVG